LSGAVTSEYIITATHFARWSTFRSKEFRALGSGEAHSISSPTARHNSILAIQFCRVTKAKESAMCYHKYTHYQSCAAHVPIHTHICPKNIMQDATRVIFCEDYRTVQLKLPDPCPYCTPRTAAANMMATATTTRKQDYPTPPKT